MRKRHQPREVHARLAGDAAHLWRLESFYGLELLRTHYTRHIFPRHLHKTFVIELVEQGTDEFFCQGAVHAAPVGSVVIISFRRSCTVLGAPKERGSAFH